MSVGVQRKILIFRLSSIGDVILASSVLQAPELARAHVEWVVSSEFSGLLKGHPRIARVWEFDRRQGFRAWRELLNAIHLSRFDEIVDLHGSLRTQFVRLKVLGLKLAGLFRGKMRVLRKPRLSRFLYLLLKSHCPKSWRPAQARACAARALRLKSSDAFPTDLGHLLKKHALPAELEGKTYWALMPGSKWASKAWTTEGYVEWIRSTGLFPVILGGRGDACSGRLVAALEEARIPHWSAVGKFTLAETAPILARAQAYLGSDTGLGHLAEALGTRANVIFGPTTPDFGFAPWRPESRSIGLDLGCRPCGKDGRVCIRVWDRYACLRRLSAENVRAQLGEPLQESSRESSSHEQISGKNAGARPERA